MGESSVTAPHAAITSTPIPIYRKIPGNQRKGVGGMAKPLNIVKLSPTIPKTSETVSKASVISLFSRMGGLLAGAPEGGILQVTLATGGLKIDTKLVPKK